VVIIGLALGDEGKGSVADFVTRESEASTVVRFNGGAQAAHRVVHAGKHHVFAQFGSGTLAGARTFLSRFMLVNPSALLNEARRLEELGLTDPLDRVFIDERAVLTTPFHVAANRIREEHRGGNRHGSCGMGIGETVADDLAGIRLRVTHLSSPWLAGALEDFRAHKRTQLADDGIPIGDSPAWRTLLDEDAAAATAERWRAVAERCHIVDADWLAQALKAGVTVFEGAQGVLLDQDMGFNPYTTWSTTTFDNATALLGEAGFGGEVVRMGVVRSYLTRHGPGPFPTYDPSLDLDEAENRFNPWQREFRAGAMDYALMRYALGVSGPDQIAMTHLDAPEHVQRKVCVRHENLPPWEASSTPSQWHATAMAEVRPVYQTLARPADEAFQERFGIPVTLTSHGPSSADKRWRKP
jgi:adenylosuccinate synthase